MSADLEARSSENYRYLLEYAVLQRHKEEIVKNLTAVEDQLAHMRTVLNEGSHALHASIRDQVAHAATVAT